MVSESAARAAYAFVFGVQPNDRSVVAPFLDSADPKQMFERMVGHHAFLSRWQSVVLSIAPSISGLVASDAEVMAQFPAYTGPGTPGFVTDFLGNKLRTTFVHWFETVNGQVWPPPTAHSHSLHQYGEWVGTLRAVLEGDPSKPFVVFELGAGWAPWCVATILACRQKGFTRVHATAVEASVSHLAYIRQHFADNGIPPDQYTLHHAAATPTDGFVEFPALDDAAMNYGAGVGDVQLVDRPGTTNMVRVPGMSIATLLKDVERVDLMHIDIQGSEADVVAASRKVLKAKVRRMVIGTHNREVEHRLLVDLAADGWLLEQEQACVYHIQDGTFYLYLDGNQVWRNPAV